MTLSVDTITSASFKAQISPAMVMPLVESIPLNLPLVFSDVKNIVVASGQYTPNNDYLYLAQGIAPSKAPNFIIVICDGQLNLTMTCTQAWLFNNIPVQRFGFYSWVSDPTNLTNGLYIEGRNTMPQNVPVNYTIIMGQAVLT